uniref:Uncharacterized protein n=1 Tax=Romanomermis culicivorax TaxID=13658 RepID=A0A915JR03_ROMCU
MRMGDISLRKEAYRFNTKPVIKTYFEFFDKKNFSFLICSLVFRRITDIGPFSSKSILINFQSDVTYGLAQNCKNIK